MNVLIYKGGKYLDITSNIVSEISINERIDEVLDSGQFNLLTQEFDMAIEPFTRLIVKLDDGTNIPFFATSTCNKYMTKEGLYFHSVQLYEPTKIFECFIVGTKAFSIVEGKEEYNSNYDRIKMLSFLMSEKYNIRLFLDDKLKSMLKEREYSFGPGTTLWDALSEIMRTEGYIPRCIFNDGYDSNWFTISADSIEDLKTDEIQELNNIISVVSNQNVDEYCSEMEAEYSEVVDRDTLQDVLVSCRSQGDIICKDTACLITPSKIENLKRLSIACNLEVKGTRICLIPKSSFDWAWTYCDHNGSSEHYTDKSKLDYYRVWIPPTSVDYNNFFLSKLKLHDLSTYNELKDFLISCGWKERYSDDRYLMVYTGFNVSEMVGTKLEHYFDNYYLAIYNDDFGFKNHVKYDLVYTASEINLTRRVLNKTQWDLLDAADKPKYLFWSTDQNYIDGFYNTFHDGFWESIIFGEVKPFIESFIEDGMYNYIANALDDKNYTSDAALYYWTIMLKNYNDLAFQNSIIAYNKTVIMFSDHVSDSANQYQINDYTTAMYQYLEEHKDFTNNIYNVKYYTKSPAFLKTNKSNYDCQITTSKSFNSGASLVDYNQLVSGIKRAVDMQGLPIYTITSKDNISVGKRCQYGYIISKDSTYKVQDNSTIKSFVYNCCQNYQQIAAAIGVDSQYEATNLPQSGIVSRFIYTSSNNILKNSRLYLALKLSRNDTNYIIKPLQMLEKNGERLFVCETEDNYCFDYQKASSNVDNYYINKAVPYSNSDNTIDYYFDAMIVELNTLEIGVYNNLPRISNNKFNILATISFKTVYKDPRERLIFVIKHTGSLV